MKKFLTVMIAFLIVFTFSSNASAQSGCCSWHGGISHCDGAEGRYVYRDGTYSPTCGCKKSVEVPDSLLSNLQSGELDIDRRQEESSGEQEHIAQHQPQQQFPLHNNITVNVYTSPIDQEEKEIAVEPAIPQSPYPAKENRLSPLEARLAERNEIRSIMATEPNIEEGEYQYE